jgi:hypothetical protein
MALFRLFRVLHLLSTSHESTKLAELDVGVTSASSPTFFDGSMKTAVVVRTGTDCFVTLWCFEEKRELTSTLHAAHVGQWVSLRTDLGSSARICSAARPLYETSVDNGVLLV